MVSIVCLAADLESATGRSTCAKPSLHTLLSSFHSDARSAASRIVSAARNVASALSLNLFAS